MQHVQKRTQLAVLIASLALFSGPIILQAAWESLSLVPISPTDGAVSFTIGDTAYIAGGLGNTRILAWDQSKGWRAVGSFPDGHFRAWSFALVHDGVAVIGGGDTTGGFEVTDQVFAFDPSTGELTEMSPLPFGPRDGVWSFVIDGTGYIGGGFDGEFLVPDMWEYDFESDTWEQLPQPPLPPMIFPSTFVLNGNAYVMGGGVNFAGTNAVYKYDPQSGEWQSRARFPGGARQAGIAFEREGLGYFGLGQRAYDTTYGDIWRYDPMANHWEVWRTDYPDERSAWSTATVVGTELLIGTGAGFEGTSLIFSRDFYRLDLSAPISSVEERPNYVERIDLE